MRRAHGPRRRDPSRLLHRPRRKARPGRSFQTLQRQFGRGLRPDGGDPRPLRRARPDGRQGRPQRRGREAARRRFRQPLCHLSQRRRHRPHRLRFRDRRRRLSRRQPQVDPEGRAEGIRARLSVRLARRAVAHEARLARADLLQARARLRFVLAALPGPEPLLHSGSADGPGRGLARRRVLVRAEAPAARRRRRAT